MGTVLFLLAAAVDNVNANSHNFIFTIKDTKLFDSLVTLSAGHNQKPSKLLSKLSERPVNWNEFKRKNENKNMKNEYRYFLESKFVRFNRLFVLVYSNQDNSAKRFKTWRYYIPKGIIKNYNVIINGRKLLWPTHWLWYKITWKNKKVNNRTRWILHYWMFIRLWIYQNSLKINRRWFEQTKRIRCWSKSN